MTGIPLAPTVRRKLAAVTTALVVLSVVNCAYAIDPQRAISQYVRDKWGPEHGFPRGPVYAIAQTGDGYLWIGTEAGLVRFDGLQFRVIQNPSQAPPITSVIGLTADRDGSLWLRLRDLSLLRYRNGEFENPFTHPESASDITALTRGSTGELLAARTQLGAFTFRDSGLAPVALASGIPRSPVISLAQTGEGSIWLGTRGVGLFKLKAGRTSEITQGLPDRKINCLLPDGKNDLWIGTDNGIARWDGSNIITEGAPATLQHVQVLALLKDRDANLWAGTDSGRLLRMNEGGVESLDHTTGEPRNAITALFEDREGNLWIGSADGIERVRDSPFVSYSEPEGLPTGGGNPIFVDGQKRVWFAPVTGGLWWTRDGHHGSVRAAGLNNDVVYSIGGNRTELWLGRQRGGLTRLRSEGGAFRAQTYTKVDGLAQNSVYAVYQDREGVVWAGTLSGGVSKLERGRFTTYTIADGLASNTVVSIAESPDGKMWFATPTGLSSFSRGEWKTFRTADGLPSDNVNSVLIDPKGVVWAGTTAGLSFLSTGRFQVPDHVPASLKEQILGLVEDERGWLWAATSNHVLRVKRGKLLESSLADGDVLQYGLADGLRGVEGVKRHSSVVKDATGRIWFSLNRGLSVVDPARLTSSSAPAIPHIQSVTADGVSVLPGSPVRVEAGSQRLVFEYSGLSLSVPERVRFRFRLEGFDRVWSEPVTHRQTAYTNLGPGRYRFHVMASNPDGVWSGEEASLAFQVMPAYWQTWWFRMGFLVCCFAAAVSLYRLRLRHLTAQLNVRFEERLAERNRIAQELHDTLLQGFISVSMQVHAAADCLPPDSRATPILTTALNVMRQVIDEGRNAVQGLRTSPGNSMDLAEAFSRIRDELIPENQSCESVRFRVITEGNRRPLHPVLRDEIYRIGREALINAFRHARASTIEVVLSYSATALGLLIRDNGCGIHPKVLHGGRDGHWGLIGMRERANRIGAKLRLWSSGTGTEIELVIPGHIAFQSQPKMGGM